MLPMKIVIIITVVMPSSARPIILSMSAHTPKITDITSITISELTSTGEQTNNTDAGVGAVEIVFGGVNSVYAGTVIFDFTIEKFDIADMYISSNAYTSVVYSGQQIVKDLAKHLCYYLVVVALIY